MTPSRRLLRSLFQVFFVATASTSLLHCSGVDGTTMALGPGASDSASDADDAGRRGRDSGTASRDASASGDAGSRGGDSGTTRDSGTTPDASTAPPAPLMWAIDMTTLYSFDSDTGTIHRAANFSAGCGSMNDVAVDADGNLFGAVDYTTTDADGGAISYYTPARIHIDTATSTATCSYVDSAVPSDQPSLGFRASGDMLGVSFLSSAYVAKVSPTTAATQPDMFLLDATNATGDDVACSASGTCWAAIGFGGAGAGIVSFSDTLTGAASAVSTSAISCWGLGYAKNALFCFEGNGAISRVDLTSDPPTLTTMTLHMDDASALPTYWSGAASRPD